MSSYRTLAAGILSTGLAFSFGQAVASEPVATVSHIDGVALVSQGPDYVTATPGMALREGDRLMAMEGGSATLTFTDGCTQQVGDNTVVTVGNAESCSAGTVSSTQVGPYVAALGAAGGAVGTGIIAAGVVGTVVLLAATDVIEVGSDDRPSPSP